MRKNPTSAVVLLLEAQAAAKYAEAHKWQLAHSLVRAGQLTSVEAARALGVHEATYFRKLAKWVASDNPGVGV
jgi:hypothetical protein